jgi:hypothetical protein
MSTPATSSGLPPDEPKWISGQDDEIRWGQSKSGNVPAGSRDEYADRAGLPRLPESANGVEYIHAAQAQRNSAGIRVGLLTATVRLADSIRLALESRRQVFARRWLRSASLGSR